jgi:hypothetical protein
MLMRTTIALAIASGLVSLATIAHAEGTVSTYLQDGWDIKAASQISSSGYPQVVLQKGNRAVVCSIYYSVLGNEWGWMPKGCDPLPWNANSRDQICGWSIFTRFGRGEMLCSGHAVDACSGSTFREAAHGPRQKIRDLASSDKSLHPGRRIAIGRRAVSATIGMRPLMENAAFGAPANRGVS